MNKKTNKYMVCLGLKSWDGMPDRTQHLMSHLKDITIFYFYPPTKEMPYPTARKDAWKEEHIFAYALPKAYSTMHSGILIHLRMKTLNKYISKVLNKHGVTEQLLWITHPLQCEMIGLLPYDYLIYDCAGYWEYFLQQYQELLLEKADLVLSVSETLEHDLRQYHKNVMLLEHGVDYDLFQSGNTERSLQKKIERFGFVGEIDFDLDLSSLVYVARERPTWKFCLMGRCHKENPFLEVLKELPNVILVGSRLPEDMAEFLFSCSVLLDFRCLDGGIGRSSSRLFEYCATGLPIVSYLWQGEIEVFPDVVYSAYSEKEFLLKCEVALAEPKDLVSERRKQHGEKGSWKNRAEKISQIFHTAGIC